MRVVWSDNMTLDEAIKRCLEMIGEQQKTAYEAEGK